MTRRGCSRRPPFRRSPRRFDGQIAPPLQSGEGYSYFLHFTFCGSDWSRSKGQSWPSASVEISPLADARYFVRGLHGAWTRGLVATCKPGASNWVLLDVDFTDFQWPRFRFSSLSVVSTWMPARRASKAGGGRPCGCVVGLVSGGALFLGAWMARWRLGRVAGRRVLGPWGTSARDDRVGSNGHTDPVSRSYKERLDPGGETELLSTGMRALTWGPLGWLLKQAGVDEEGLNTARSAQQRYYELVSWAPEVAECLAPLGWIAFSHAPEAEYREAARLARDGDAEAAEVLLTEVWNGGDRLRWALIQVQTIYRGNEAVRMIGHNRRLQLDEALDDHVEERYASAINIVLPQVDGIVYDLTGKDAKSFFAARSKALHLHDEETLAGHPEGLAVLADLFNKGRKSTTTDGELRRHGILHGRELGYDTLRNSTKVFVALLSVLEWARPLADAKAEQLEREREERYAGSKECDEFGQRLDQREFKETKNALQRLAGMQMGWYRNRGGRYRPDLLEMLSTDGLPEDHGIELSVAPDGQSWWAWRRTVSGWCFAIGATQPPPDQWLFDGPEPPGGFPGQDPAWGEPWGLDAENW